jgi:hypothetical protein
MGLLLDPSTQTMVFLQSKMKLDKMQECSHRCSSDADDANKWRCGVGPGVNLAGLEIRF